MPVRSESENSIVDESLAQNPNWIAFQAMLVNNEFASLSPDTRVAFCEGELVGMGLDSAKLIESMLETEYLNKGLIVFQVGITEDSIEYSGSPVEVD